MPQQESLHAWRESQHFLSLSNFLQPVQLQVLCHTIIVYQTSRKQERYDVTDDPHGNLDKPAAMLKVLISFVALVFYAQHCQGKHAKEQLQKILTCLPQSGIALWSFVRKGSGAVPLLFIFPSQAPRQASLKENANSGRLSELKQQQHGQDFSLWLALLKYR